MAFGKKTEKVKGPKLGFGRLLAWKSSDVASAACFVIVNTYLSIYCTNYIGIEAAALGTILLLSNVIDAITDLIACYVIDNSKVTKWGKARPYELGILGVWICTILMFHTGEGWGTGLKYVWVFCMYTFTFGVFNTFRSAAMQPYMVRAFGGDRTLIGKLGSYGGLVTMLGSMVVTMTFPVLMGKIATSAAGWRTLILLYGIPMLLLGLPRFFFIKEDPKIDAGLQHDKVSIKQIFQMITKNKFVWFYAGVMMAFNAVSSIGVVSYYFTYVVGNTDIMGIFSVLSFQILPLMLFMPMLLKKFSAPQIIAATSALAIAGYVVNFFAGSSIILLIVGGLMTAIATLPLSYLSGLIIMDLSTYNEYLDLPRMDASTTIVSNNFASQIGQGIGGALLGFLLQASGFISSTGEEIVQQPDSAIFMIRCLYSIVPLILMAMLVVFAILLSKLNKQMPEIEATLAERKAVK